MDIKMAYGCYISELEKQAMDIAVYSVRMIM